MRTICSERSSSQTCLGSVLRRSATCQFFCLRNIGERKPVIPVFVFPSLKGMIVFVAARANPLPQRLIGRRLSTKLVGALDRHHNLAICSLTAARSCATPARHSGHSGRCRPYTHIAPSDLRMTRRSSLEIRRSSRTIGAAEWRAVVRHGLVSSPLALIGTDRLGSDLECSLNDRIYPVSPPGLEPRATIESE
jgi:hypothetical protein